MLLCIPLTIPICKNGFYELLLPWNFMKKLITISLAVLYLAISSGVVVNLHYCMGELADIALGHSQSDKCNGCGMANEGCCYDDVKVIKLQDSQQLFTAQVDIAKVEALLLVHQPSFNLHMTGQKSSLSQNNHSPPVIGDISLSILNCVFRI